MSTRQHPAPRTRAVPASHGRGRGPARRARALPEATARMPRQVARTLLRQALTGDMRALAALREGLDLPGMHEGAARAERRTLRFIDPDPAGMAALRAATARAAGRRPASRPRPR